MKQHVGKLLLLSSMVALAGCGQSEAPTGQVVATVNGKEITVSELNAELSDLRSSAPQNQADLQQLALQSIVNRHLLAQAAEDKGLDDSPMGAMAKEKAEQIAYIALLQQQVGRTVPKVSADEAKQFVLENRDMFDSRKIFLVDQVVVQSPSAPLFAELKAAETMDQVQGTLAKFNLPVRANIGVIDALTIEPAAARQIAALPTNAVFILPADGAVRINRVREVQIEPITGDLALNVATKLLQDARASTQQQQTVDQILRDGQSKVQYNKGYKPKAAPTPNPAAAAPPAAR